MGQAASAGPCWRSAISRRTNGSYESLRWPVGGRLPSSHILESDTRLFESIPLLARMSPDGASQPVENN